MRSAYRLLIATKQQREDWLEQLPVMSDCQGTWNMWSKLWGVRIPSKIKNFIWRLAQTSHPTGDVRRHRNMTTIDECSICRYAADTWRHALLRCDMAKAVWALLEDDLVEYVFASKKEDPKLCIFELLDSVSHTEAIKVMVTLSSFWWAQRRTIHEEQFKARFRLSDLFRDSLMILNSCQRRRLCKGTFHQTYAAQVGGSGHREHQNQCRRWC